MLVCRYEDLAAGGPAIDRLFAFLALSPPDRSIPLLDQRGDAWSHNSSFPGRGGHRHGVLRPTTRLFLEKLTQPELAFMGYDIQDMDELGRFDLDGYAEDPCPRPEFVPLLRDYAEQIAWEKAYLESPGRDPEGGRPWA